jgi:hypothetical protein
LRPDGSAPDFALDYELVQLTGAEILVSGSTTAALNGIWNAVGEERYNGRRYYRPASGGSGIIYYFGTSSYGWIMYSYGSSAGGGPPDEHSVVPDDAGNPNAAYLAPITTGYCRYMGSNTSTIVTVTA